jgi:hypothetical protein
MENRDATLAGRELGVDFHLSGMEGRGSRKARWSKRHVIKGTARKKRRKDDRFASQEDT